MPIVVVPTYVRSGASVSFGARSCYAHVIDNEGGVCVVIIILVLENMGLFVLVILFDMDRCMAVA